MKTKKQKSQLEMEKFCISRIQGHISDINIYCKRLSNNIALRKNFPFEDERNIKNEYMAFYISMIKKHIDAIVEASSYLAVPNRPLPF